MDTLVCVKAVAREAPRVREEGDAPQFEQTGTGALVMNESDAYAVDEAVVLKKRHGGRVGIVTVGPLGSQEVLYAAMAKGADDGLRVDADVRDPAMVAGLLAAVVREGSYDLILTGVESYEELASVVGPALAAHLDLPFASAVSGVELTEGGRQVLVTKEMGGGFFQKLAMPLPAVLSVQSGVCRLSYAPTMRVLQARRRPLRSVSPQSLGVEIGAPASRLVAIEPPRREREPEMVSGTPGEIAAALMDRIERALHG